MKSPDVYVKPFQKLLSRGDAECRDSEKKAVSAAAMYPSVWNLRRASVYEISDAAGVPEEDALVLSVFADLLPRYIRGEDIGRRFVLKDRESMLPYLNRLFLCQDAPCLFLFLFNKKRVLISEYKIQEGITPPSDIQVNVAVRKALEADAAFVVFSQYRASSPHVGWKQLQPFIAGMRSVSMFIEEVYQIDPGQDTVDELTEVSEQKNNRENK